MAHLLVQDLVELEAAERRTLVGRPVRVAGGEELVEVGVACPLALPRRRGRGSLHMLHTGRLCLPFGLHAQYPGTQTHTDTLTEEEPAVSDGPSEAFALAALKDALLVLPADAVKVEADMEAEAAVALARPLYPAFLIPARTRFRSSFASTPRAFSTPSVSRARSAGVLCVLYLPFVREETRFTRNASS